MSFQPDDEVELRILKFFAHIARRDEEFRRLPKWWDSRLVYAAVVLHGSSDAVRAFCRDDGALSRGRFPGFVPGEHDACSETLRYRECVGVTEYSAESAKLEPVVFLSGAV